MRIVVALMTTHSNWGSGKVEEGGSVGFVAAFAIAVARAVFDL